MYHRIWLYVKPSLGKAWLDDARTPWLMTSFNMFIEFGDPFDFTGGTSTGGVGRLDFVEPCSACAHQYGGSYK
jgi:hypothetical protein